MAYDRDDTGRWAWIKTVGTAEDRLPQDWLQDRGYLLDSVWFPKHPRSIVAGDLLAYYAAGRRVFPAVVEVTTGVVEEDHDDHYPRWPWKLAVQPRLVIPRLDLAPTLQESGISPLRLRRQSQILLTSEEWDGLRSLFLPQADSRAVPLAA